MVNPTTATVIRRRTGNIRSEIFIYFCNVIEKLTHVLLHREFRYETLGLLREGHIDLYVKVTGDENSILVGVDALHNNGGGTI